MQTSVTFKNIDPSDPLKAHVQDKLSRLDKLLDNPAEANVVLSIEKHRHIAEINISGDRLSIIGKEETNDMYSAIDMVLNKLEKQIKKSKQKIKGHRTNTRSRSKSLIPEASETYDASPTYDDDTYGEIRIKNIEYKPMDVEEAIMQMDLVSDSFMVFTNARTDRVNVIYRRNDGHLGLIQPNL